MPDVVVYPKSEMESHIVKSKKSQLIWQMGILIYAPFQKFFLKPFSSFNNEKLSTAIN